MALFRGINVGRAKRVAMADLRELIEGLGYRDVRTLLNSGNAVFTAPARGEPAARIEAAFTRRLGFSSRVIVLSAAELAEIVAANTLLDVGADHSRLLVTVLRDPADRKKLAAFLRQDWSPEALALGARTAYLWCPQGLIESAVGDAVHRSLGDGATTRNWATITKLAALAAAE